MQVTYSLANRTFTVSGTYFHVSPGTDGVTADNYDLVAQRYRLHFSGSNLVISDNLSAVLPYEHDFLRSGITFYITTNPSNLGVVGGSVIISGSATPTNFQFMHDTLEIEISINPSNTSVFRVLTAEPVLNLQFP